MTALTLRSQVADINNRDPDRHVGVGLALCRLHDHRQGLSGYFRSDDGDRGITHGRVLAGVHRCAANQDTGDEREGYRAVPVMVNVSPASAQVGFTLNTTGFSSVKTSPKGSGTLALI